MTTYTSGTGQTVFDVVLQQYGDLDGGIAALLADNPGLILSDGSFNQFHVAHLVTPNRVVNKRVANILNTAKPASRLDVAVTIIDGDGDGLTDGDGDMLTDG